nr:uncharacterized protein LOC117861399 [Setaria viridis]
MAFVVRVPPMPPPPALTPAPLARWRLALAITRAAVGLASAGGFFTSIAAMAIGFLTCGEEWLVFRDSHGENCPAFRAAFTAFLVSTFSIGMVSCVSNLLRMCVARSKAKTKP